MSRIYSTTQFFVIFCFRPKWGEVHYESENSPTMSKGN